MRSSPALVLTSILLMVVQAGAVGGNESKNSDSPTETPVQPASSQRIWALPTISESTARTPRPETREFDPERWQRERSGIFYIATSTNSWQTPHPGSQRSDAPGNPADTNLMELRWKLGAAHRSIPTLEIAGCDLISARDFYPGPRLIRSAEAPPSGRLQRARQMLSSKLSDFVRTGCE